MRKTAQDFIEGVSVPGLLWGLIMLWQAWAGPPLKAWQLAFTGALLILNSALLLHEFYKGESRA
jgi:hypothetical protein